MYYVYVLESKKDGKLYKGFTTDLQARIVQHNSGKNRSTNQRGPWNLIHYEAYISKEDALERERFLKTGWGRKNLENLLQNYFNKK